MKKWEREPFVGYKPKFRMACPSCNNEMVLRHSKLYQCNIWQSYKCPECDRFIRFVPSYVMGESFDYIQKIYEERGKIGMFVPTEEWLENEKIKERLSDLGYW